MSIYGGLILDSEVFCIYKVQPLLDIFSISTHRINALTAELKAHDSDAPVTVLLRDSGMFKVFLAQNKGKT